MTPPTHLPADALPDLLDAGVRVFAPADYDTTPGVFLEYVMGGARCHVAWLSSRRPEIMPITRPLPSALALDLTHWTGRVQVCRVLARGVTCAYHAKPRPLCRDCADDGPICPSDGYACDPAKWTCCRKPAPAWHLLPESEGGRLPDALASHSPALLVAHALDVAGGGVGVSGVLGAWEVGHRSWRGLHVRVRDNLAVSQVGERGWRLCYLPGFRDGFGPSGPETGPEGQRLADTAALAHGFALLDAPNLLTLPTWGRP